MKFSYLHIVLVISFLLYSHTSYKCSISETLKKVEISGQFLGGIGILSQDKPSKSRDPIYYSGNIDVAFPYSETEQFYATVRIQPNQLKKGSLGLTYPKSDFPDFKLAYSADHHRHFAFSSIDIPFGQHMNTLSDNANTFNNTFLVNSLLHDAISGPVGKPKLIGVHAYFTYPSETYTLAIANSSKSNQNSEQGNFTLVFSAHTKRLIDKLTIGGAVMKADEFRDVDDGIDIGLLGLLADVDYLTSWGGINGYIAHVNYDDTLGETEGNVLSWMLGTYFKYADYRYSIAFSQWSPKDNDGTAGSSPLPTVGFGRLADGNLLTVKNQAVSRLQVAITKRLSQTIDLKTELFYDNYHKTPSNTLGLLSFVNIHFQGTKKVTADDPGY